MKVSREEAAANRERIVDVASRLFREKGFDGIGVADLMKEAGLTPMQIIQAFSKGGAETLGIDEDFGTLAKGKAADLIVVEKSPLDDITHMRSISAVYLGGKKFE